MNGLLIIIGESFRYGNQGTRIRGVPESYDAQINACNTHIKFINLLKNKFNYNINVFIGTYTTQYDNDLLNIYKNYLVGNKIYENPLGLTNLYKNCIDENNLDNYNFILYFRIDLFLKDKFLEIFNPSWNTIKFATICWKKDSVYNNKPRVNDMMLFIPKKFIIYSNQIIIGHESWYFLVNNLKINDYNIDVMINTYHDSDSSKDYNPLYYIVNRSENQIWHSENEIFNKILFENFMVVKYKKKNKLFILYLIIILILLLL